MALLDPDAARRKSETRLTRNWAEHLLGQASAAWPHTITLDTGSTGQREADITALLDWAARWQRDSSTRGLQVAQRNRRVHGTDQLLPHHLLIPTIEDAARLVGAPWPDRVATARVRLPELAEASTAPVDAAALRKAAELPGHDFEILAGTLRWLAGNDEEGLTARQVPVRGLHSKWLERHRGLVARLLGRELRLTRRPDTVEYTYLDPVHLGGGGRRWDTAALGDKGARPVYAPDVIVIAENKDTAYYFPPIAGGIAVHGGGDAAAARLTGLTWIADCPQVYYWGDIDADGYGILDDLRRRGLRVTSLLMDSDAFSAYQHLGVDHHPDGRPISVTGPNLPHLAAHEQQVYAQLTDPAYTGHRRIEQERIPLPDALAAIERIRS